MVKSEVPKESFSDYLYNAKEGTVMGRTATSWAKILGFYCVYYGFLACLFYFGLSYYESGLPIPGLNQGPKLSSRVDQPGIGTYPFYTYRDDRDNLEWPLSTAETDASQHYVKHLEKFLNQYNQDSAEVCDVDAKDKVCKIPNYDVARGLDLHTSIKEKKPYVFLSVNKIMNWVPIKRNNSGVANLGPDEFVQNAVYFDCYEVKGSEIVDGEERNFDVVPAAGSERYLSPNLFPFNGQEYQKPFVIYQIVPIEGKGWSEENHQFRCDAYADNIEGPGRGNFNEQQPQAKINVGYTKFGYKYE